MKIIYSAIVVVVIGISGCVPYKKTVILDGDKKNPLHTDTFFSYQRDPYQLQAHDIVDIKIFSANEEGSSYFDKTFSATRSTQPNVAGLPGGDVYYMTGYIVDDSGYVKLPVFGDFKAEGKTINELRKGLESELSRYFDENYLYVTVKLGGIRYVVTGEVRSPGSYVKLQSQVNIIEALASAGDFTELSKRDEVIIYRQYPEGTKAHKVNLLDEDILSSEYYFIRPNDIIQVKPMRLKSLGLGDAFLENTTSLISFSVSILSLYLLLTQQQRNGG